MKALFDFDETYYNSGYTNLCGVDEAGRGPLAGPVFAAAVIFPQGMLIEGINDSKKLSEKKRELLYNEIISKAVAYGIAYVSETEIDEINILQATFLAMNKAIAALQVKPGYILVDGDKLPIMQLGGECIIKGDSKSAAIAAASILAKVSRDHYLYALDKQYPEYCFNKHKGYGTQLHYEMLTRYGISPVHRKSFLKKLLTEKTNV